MILNIKKRKVNEEFRKNQISEKLKSKRIAFAFPKENLLDNDLIYKILMRINMEVEEGKFTELKADLTALNILVFNCVNDRQIINDILTYKCEKEQTTIDILLQRNLLMMEEIEPLIPDLITSIFINLFSVDVDIEIITGFISNLMGKLIEYLHQSQYLKIKKQVKQKKKEKIIK
jgi:hypothetical protein